MDRSYNELLIIGIPAVLMNLISCHGFMKDKNSTVILLCCNWLMEYYLAKEFFILEHNSKNLSIVPNEAKQIINAINMHDSDFVMAFYTSINSVENTINKFHIVSDLNFGYIHNFYHDKQESIDYMFCQYIKPLLKDIDNTELIQEWKIYIYSGSYEKS